MKVFRIAALAILPLAACAPEIETHLYLQDVMEVVGTGTSMIVPATLRIPENSADSCAEGLAALATSLAAITPLTDTGKCVENNNNQFSEFTIDLPVVDGNTTLDLNYLALVHLDKVESALGHGVAMRLELTRTLDDVQTAIGRAQSDSFSVGADQNGQPQFIVEFENDTRDPAQLAPNFVFVDDQPGMPDSQPISLDRRQSVKLVLSDVASAYVAEAHSFTFATVYTGGN